MGEAVGLIGAAGGLGLGIAQTIQGKNAQQANQRALDKILNLQTSSAEGILGQTSPLRSLTAASLFDVLSGNRNPNLRVFAPERQSIEGQFQQARNAIIENTPNMGGQLNKALSDLELTRAQAVGGLESDVRKKAFEDALRIGYGVAPQTVFPTFQGAAGTLSNLSAQNIGLQQSGGAAAGSSAALGSLIALKQGQRNVNT